MTDYFFLMLLLIPLIVLFFLISFDSVFNFFMDNLKIFARVTIAVSLLSTAIVCSADQWYLSPDYGAGQTLSNPGHPSIYISPDYGGGRTITIPGRGSGYISPDYGGGRTITIPQPNPYIPRSNNYGSGYNY